MLFNPERWKAEITRYQGNRSTFLPPPTYQHADLQEPDTLSRPDDERTKTADCKQAVRNMPMASNLFFITMLN